MNKLMKKVLSTWLLLAVVVFGGTEASHATQQGKGQAQETVQSVVAKQASLVSEVDVNGLKGLLKRREGSLTVAAALFIRGGSANINAQNAGLFIRGGSANINAQNAGIESLMLSVA